MDNVKELLEQFKRGETSVDEVLKVLQTQPFEDIGYAKLDYHRNVRQGANEVVYGEAKTAEQIVGILTAMGAKGLTNVLITRLDYDKYCEVARSVPLAYYETARIGVFGETKLDKKGKVVILSGGTGDIPVCEEAAVTAETLGSHVERIYDVGVSGLHRLLARLDALVSARAIIVVAGMEGALASVVGGLVACPVIAVPTSVGYGASYGGIAALLSMLNSCSAGVSVVNIDNGFGAGYLANMINGMTGR